MPVCAVANLNTASNPSARPVAGERSSSRPPDWRMIGVGDRKAEAGAATGTGAPLEALGQRGQHRGRNRIATIDDMHGAVGGDPHLDRLVGGTIRQCVVDQVAQRDGKGVDVCRCNEPLVAAVIEHDAAAGAGASGELVDHQTQGRHQVGGLAVARNAGLGAGELEQLLDQPAETAQ